MKKTNLSVVVFTNLIGTFLLRGITFFTTPIVTRLLSPTYYGITSIYIVWITVISLIAGVQTVGTISNAYIDMSETKFHKYLSSSIFISFLSSCILFLIMCYFAEPLSQLLKLDKILIILMVPHAFGNYCINYLSTTLIVKHEVSKNLSLNLMVSVTSITLAICWMVSVDSNKYLAYLFGQAIPHIITGVLIFVWFAYKGRTFYNKIFWKYCLPLSLPLILHGLSGSILSQSDRVMLQRFSGEHITGIYSFTYNISTIINIVWQAINSVWNPFYYIFLKENNISELKRHAYNYDFLFTSLTLGFIYVYPEVVKLISAPTYWDGFSVMPMIVLAYYFNYLYGFPTTYEFYHKKNHWIATATAGAAVINIGLNMVLIPIWNSLGAAIATIISYILMFIFHDFVARFIIKNFPIKWRFYLKSITIILLGVTYYYIFYQQWIMRWLAAFCVGIALLYRIYRQKALI